MKNAKGRLMSNENVVGLFLQKMPQYTIPVDSETAKVFTDFALNGLTAELVRDFVATKTAETQGDESTSTTLTLSRPVTTTDADTNAKTVTMSVVLLDHDNGARMRASLDWKAGEETALLTILGLVD